MRYTILPDYSETLDGGSWDDYMSIPSGGTPMAKVRKWECGRSCVLYLLPAGFNASRRCNAQNIRD